MKDYFEFRQGLVEFEKHSQWKGRSDSHSPRKYTDMQYTRDANKKKSKEYSRSSSRASTGKTAGYRQSATPTKGVRGVFNLRYSRPKNTLKIP